MPLKIKGLRLSKETRPASVAPKEPKEVRRQKLVRGIERQIELIRNPEYTFERGGKKISPTAWSFQKGDKVFLSIKYGSRDVPLDGKGSTAVVLDRKEDLIPTLEAIREAASKGDLDPELEALSKNMGRAAPKNPAASPGLQTHKEENASA
ncbi:MAG: hypothetical protein K0R61_1348 [Microvirga sp.]|jgi:hypothetical protein|nr:hypothetical protein [Microvirga sp.]